MAKGSANDAAVFVLFALAALTALFALRLLGPEPEIAAADYRLMLCQDSPGLPECRVDPQQLVSRQ